jgi:hypothetical protein
VQQALHSCADVAVTCYVLDDDFDYLPGWELLPFPSHPDRFWGPLNLLFDFYLGLFPGSEDHHSRSQWPRGLRRRPSSLGRWDHGFESRLRHGCLSSWFCIVLSCVGRGLCDGLITRPNKSYQCLNKIKTPSVCEAAKVLSRTVDGSILLNDAFSVTRLYSVVDRTVSEWRWIGKYLVRRGRDLILRYYPGIRLEGLRKTTKKLNQNSR